MNIFKPRMLLFFVGNRVMNTPHYWQQRNELICDIGNNLKNFSAMMPVAMLRPVVTTLAALQREWGSSFQPLKSRKTKMPPIPRER
jgi:hypothetical protein